MPESAQTSTTRLLQIGNFHPQLGASESGYIKAERGIQQGQCDQTKLAHWSE